MWRIAQWGLLGAALLTLSGMSPTQRAVLFSGVGFVGPIDAVAGPAAMWMVSRAPSTAARGQKIMNVCDNAGNNCTDFLTDPSSGNLIAQTVGADNCKAANDCRIKTIYDVSGGKNCAGAVCDVTQGTAANMPVLTFNAVNGRACALFGGGANQVLQTAGNYTATQPQTFEALAERTGNTSAEGEIIASNTGAAQSLFFNASTNTIGAFAGNVVTKAGADSVQHAISVVINGAASALIVDGSASTGLNAGANAPAVAMLVGNATGAVHILTGYFCEGGIYASAWTATQWGAMYANQKAYYGTP